MQVRLNREIKAFCDDFRPLRKVLKSIGATLIGRKEQVDYFFHLPGSADQPASRRLKLRMDGGEPRLIYYYDRSQPGPCSVEFQLAQVRDPLIKDILEAALGVRTVVRKRREVWKKEKAIFNLDRVDSVGKIFEVEIAVNEGDDWEEQIAYYRNLFGPYLGADIVGSNEDLVAGMGTP